MTVSTIPSLAITGTANLSAGSAGAAVALPTTGSPTVALVTNTGEHTVFVALAASSSAAITSAQTGVALSAHEKLPMTIGSNTYLGVFSPYKAITVNVACGT